MNAPMKRALLGFCLGMVTTSSATGQQGGMASGRTTYTGAIVTANSLTSQYSRAQGQAGAEKESDWAANLSLSNEPYNVKAVAEQLERNRQSQTLDRRESISRLLKDSADPKRIEWETYLLTRGVRQENMPRVPPGWGLAPPTYDRPRSSCPQCQEVDPGGATIHLKEQGFDPTKLKANALSIGVAEQDISSCSTTVNLMRIRDTSGYSRVDQEGFYRQCLARPPTGPSRRLPLLENAGISACLQLYTKFDKYCLKTAPSSLDDELLKQSGILVRIVPGLPMQILCSAWRVSENGVLSARHCLAKQQLLRANQKEVAPDSLTFIPYTQATNLRFDPANRRIGWMVTGEIGKDGVHLPLSYPVEKPKVEDDLVLLAVQPADAASKSASKPTWPAVSIPEAYKKGQNLTVIGFQEFAYRKFLLDAASKNEVIPTDESLVATGEWRKFVRVHRSPVCLGLPTGRDSLGHYCQTFGRTSGSPIFAIVKMGPASQSVFLVGVQSRGTEEGEASRPNNEAVALKHGTHPYLEKLLSAR